MQNNNFDTNNMALIAIAMTITIVGITALTVASLYNNYYIARNDRVTERLLQVDGVNNLSGQGITLIELSVVRGDTSTTNTATFNRERWTGGSTETFHR
jgi:hypothetical protein